jgi:thioredoxin:protein disulfide reductase
MPRCLPLFLIGCALLSLNAQAQFGRSGPELNHVLHLETDAVHGGVESRALLEISLGEGWHVNSHTPLDEFLIPTVLDISGGPEGIETEVLYPPHTLAVLSFSTEKVAVYESRFSMGLRFTLPASTAPGDYVLRGKFHYQACNDTQCVAPEVLELKVPISVVAADTTLTSKDEERFAAFPWDGADATVSETPVEAPEAPTETGDWRVLAEQFEETARLDGYVGKADFLAFLSNEDSSEKEGNGLAGKAGWLVILGVLAFGLALNLTPCVLPLIPINLGIIGAGAQAGSKTRGFLLGLAYGVGMSGVYGLLGLLVVVGASSAFGGINASPLFNAAIAVLFVVLGLAMFDVVQIDFSRYQAKLGIRGNAKGRFAIALAMGIISALLAGACVAPGVIFTILLAQDWYSQGSTAAVFLPFLLGIGMALPWPFLGAGLSLMPKPGRWMNTVKHALGVFIILFAAYYAHEAYTLSGIGQKTEMEQAGWTTSLDEGLAQGLEENKPVLIDFWATWCKNCLVMDKTILHDDEVIAAMEGFVKVKFQAQVFTDPDIEPVLEKYGVLGLPAFVILSPATSP